MNQKLENIKRLATKENMHLAYALVDGLDQEERVLLAEDLLKELKTNKVNISSINMQTKIFKISSTAQMLIPYGFNFNLIYLSLYTSIGFEFELEINL